MAKNLSILLLFAVVLVTSCSSDKQKKLESLKKQRDQLTQQIEMLEKDLNQDGSTQSLGKVFPVEVLELKKQTFSHFIEVQGKVDGEENIAVSPRNMGVVTAIYVKQGDYVKKGQLLAQLDAQVLRQSIEELKAQLNFATDLYNKQKNLWDQKIGSEVQYLSAKNNKEALENKLKTLNDQLEMSEIRSPIDGTVEDIPIKIGQSVSPGLPAFRVVNFSKVKVTAELAESYSSKVKKGSKVKIYFPDCQKEIDAVVDFASRFIAPINRTFQVECRLSAISDIEFRANMVAILKINDYTSNNVIVIPVNSFLNSGNDKYVFVAAEENGRKVAKKRVIKVGSTYNKYAEILEGLQEGDKLIVSGFQNLEDGHFISY